MSAYPIRLLGVAAALLFGLLSGCCVRQQNARPIYPYDHPSCYTENFSRLPAEQRKAKQRRLQSDNDTEDWTGFFIVYSYGMWRDIPTPQEKTLSPSPKLTAALNALRRTPAKCVPRDRIGLAFDIMALWW